jgi:Domain of unknown function (DUF5658)
MNHEEIGGERGQGDRRQRPTKPLDALWCRGRRKAPRRSEERAGTYYVDRFSATTLAMIVSLLVLTIADGILTVELLDSHGQEVNPFMAYLLGRSRHAFFVGKYVLTAAGLPFLLVFKNYRLFGTRFRVGFLFPAFIGLYVVLLFYQWSMLKWASGIMLSLPCGFG